MGTSWTAYICILKTQLVRNYGFNVQIQILGNVVRMWYRFLRNEIIKISSALKLQAKIFPLCFELCLRIEFLVNSQAHTLRCLQILSALYYTIFKYTIIWEPKLFTNRLLNVKTSAKVLKEFLDGDLMNILRYEFIVRKRTLKWWR